MVNVKSNAELIDELITLCLKLSHGLNINEILGRLEDILLFFEGEDISEDLRTTLKLMALNATSWMAQDNINGEDGLEYAILAQDANRERSKGLKLLGASVMEKTY